MESAQHSHLGSSNPKGDINLHNPCLPPAVNALKPGEHELADRVEELIILEMASNGGRQLNQDDVIEITRGVEAQLGQSKNNGVNTLGYDPLPRSHQGVNHGCY